MKPLRFLLVTIIITVFALIYVWQQTEIFRLAYAGQKNLNILEDLLDKNTVLRYNIKRNASLIYIGDKVSEVAGFKMPDTYRFVRVGNSSKSVIASKQVSKRENIVSRFFSIKRQAEAKTITPLNMRKRDAGESKP